ncbi:hypothetical protein A3K62_01350 [Candidatus Pacearchaeota archaeon RBG_16_35_8]|nr:MAG: hypothetical protein A3K62_01350 [Candidatus Pacearchaeota archaeon RBG_16_35_8]
MPEENKEVKPDLTHKLRTNPWILSTIALVVLALVLIIGSLGNFSFTGNTISANDAGTLLTNIYGDIGIDSVKEVSGMYQVNVIYQGQVLPLYVTKDGKYVGSMDLIPSDFDSNANAGAGSIVNTEVSEDDDAVLGKADAPITIIEFSDYQCPFCTKFWSETLPLIKENYIDTGKVKLIYRDFPLTSIHPMAQSAAEAAECVRKVAGNDAAYYKYHDKLFQNQASLSEENLKLWATQMGYNIGSCFDSGEFTDEVLADMNAGSAAGVTGTPGFFIISETGETNFLAGAYPFDAFQQIIEGELSNLT